MWMIRVFQQWKSLSHSGKKRGDILHSYWPENVAGNTHYTDCMALPDVKQVYPDVWQGPTPSFSQTSNLGTTHRSNCTATDWLICGCSILLTGQRFSMELLGSFMAGQKIGEGEKYIWSADSENVIDLRLPQCRGGGNMAILWTTESIATLPPFGPIEGHITYVVFPNFQPMRVAEEPVCIYLFWLNPVFTSLHLRYPVPFRTASADRIRKKEMPAKGHRLGLV